MLPFKGQRTESHNRAMALTPHNDTGLVMEKPILLQFPAEILTKIIITLDNCSLRTLLDAFPSFSRHFLLIIENELELNDRPCFFTSSSLRSVLRTEYSPIKHSSLFKLYETIIAHIPDGDNTYFDRILPKLDKCSFVHCFTRGSVEFKWSGIMEFFRDIWTAKMFLAGVHIEFDELREPFHVFHLAVINPLTSMASFKHLKSLRIEHCNSITDVDFGSLRDLTVVFTDLPNKRRPQFSGVTALEIETFVIHYSDLAPIVKDIHFGRSERDLEYYTLTICHIPSLNSLLDTPLPVYPCPIEDLDFSALTSTKVFLTLTIIGGHDNIILGLDLSSTFLHLTWKQTSIQSHPLSSEVWVMWKHKICCLFFETLLPDATFPFTSHQVQGFGAVHIIAYNGIDLGPSKIGYIASYKRSVSIHLLDRQPLSKRPKTTLSDSNLVHDGILNNVENSHSCRTIPYLALYGLKKELPNFDWKRFHKHELCCYRPNYYYHDVQF